MNNVLIINHAEKQCGVYQYGNALGRVLEKSKKYNFIYVECTNEEAYEKAIIKYSPIAVFYNYYPTTLPWLTSTVGKYGKFCKIRIIHEVIPDDVPNIEPEPLFDYYMAMDPTITETKYVYSSPCLIRDFSYVKSIPKLETSIHPIIGALGFGFWNKGFLRIIEKVKQEYDEALLRFHIPFAKFGDEGGEQAKQWAKVCEEAIQGTKLQLQVTHDFWPVEDVFKFFSQNDINMFLYEPHAVRGLSGAVEFALSAKKPIMVSKTTMFRHLFDVTPSICAEDTTIHDVIQNGTKPLEPYYEAWSNTKLLDKYESMLNTVLE